MELHLDKNILEKLKEEFDSDMEIEDIDYHAFQLTAYESNGIIDIDDYLRHIMKDLLKDTGDIIGLYNDYLSNNNYDGYYYDNDEYFFNDMFSSPMEAVRAVYYGDYRYTDEYVRFNGYGNLESCDGYDIKDEALDDDDFLQSLVDDDTVVDGDDTVEILNANRDLLIKAAEMLVQKGY